MTVTKTTLKDLILIFIIEILTIPLVISYFKFIEPKKLAAVIAAVTFVTAGIIILRITRKWPDAYASFVYWAIHIHVFIFSIPMLVGRVAFWEKDFADIKFLFLSGPEFHKLSEKGYLILMIGTLVDILVHAVKQKRLGQKKENTEKKLG